MESNKNHREKHKKQDAPKAHAKEGEFNTKNSINKIERKSYLNRQCAIPILIDPKNPDASPKVVKGTLELEVVQAWIMKAFSE